MSLALTVILPDDLAQRARARAAAANQPLEDAVLDWVRSAVEEPSLGILSDSEVLALCDATLGDSEQHELSERLEDLRESRLTDEQRDRLDQLMAAYRRGLVRKAMAWKEAVDRGIKSPVGPATDAA